MLYTCKEFAMPDQRWKLKHMPVHYDPLAPQTNPRPLQVFTVHIPKRYSQKSEPVEMFIIELLTFTAFSNKKGQ
jgi:hypothetical protein